MIEWNASKHECDLIRKIVIRAVEDLDIQPNGNGDTFMSLLMDIEAVHCNGNPLKLKELLNADDYNFLHDVHGIRGNIDRRTGALLNCFSPRYSA